MQQILSYHLKVPICPGPPSEHSGIYRRKDLKIVVAVVCCCQAVIAVAAVVVVVAVVDVVVAVDETPRKYLNRNTC